MGSMKIIHCADLHLDSEIIGLSNDKSKIRREECLHTFERMVDFAVERGVSAIIIAGDMFDQAKVTAKTRLRIIKKIEKNSEIDFLYLSGNHDKTGSEGYFGDLILPGNFKFFDENNNRFEYGNVCISGVCGNAKYDSMFYDTLKFDSQKINILCLHGQVIGYNSGKDGEVISLPKLKDKNIDYLALGHHHTFTQGRLDDRGVYVYSGCLEGRGFDETGDKGFVLLDIENGKINYEFVKFSCRNLYEYIFSVDDFSDWLSAEEQLLDEVKERFEKNSLIKLVLMGEHSLDFLIDYNSLGTKLNEYFFFAKIKDKTTLKISIDDYYADKSVRGEFVRAVLQSDLSKEDKSKVISCGINALSGEELL